MLNKKELDMRQIDPLRSVSGTHTLFLYLNVTVGFNNRSTL